MKRTEIDARFTQEVVSYIAMGYTISTETMRGSQGEISKVDLVKGNDFIRILLEERTDWDIHTDKVVMEVGRIPEDKRGYTIWNQHMEVFGTEEWFKLSKDYFTDKASAQAAMAKRFARWRQSEDERYSKKVELNLEKAARIVKPFVNRQNGCKSAKLANIKKVYKVITKEGKASYHIETRRHSFTLA